MVEAGSSRGRSETKGSAASRLRRSLSRSSKKKASTENGTTKPVQSSKIKKMMKGLSRKKKDASSVDASSNAVSIHAEEQVSVNNENDNKKVGAKEEASVGKALTLQLVLLLMDPSTRRFELLQLEFDSDKAKVSDILAQIPISVTEASIRHQKYQGVIDHTHIPQNETAKLVDFCQGKTVLVAVPKGLPIKECVRLARPILCDKQVERMLTAGKFDISGWKKKDEKEGKTKSRALPGQTSRSAPPPPASAPSDASSPDVEKESKNKSFFPTIATLALLAIIVQTAHNFLSLPIETSVVLKPGTWKSKCGIFGLLPPPVLDLLSFNQCTNSFLEVHNDGTVSIQNPDKELDILLKGGVCAANDEECVDGLVLNENGKIYIGGTQVKIAYMYGETKSLSPWPFEENPKLKLKNSSRR